MSEPRGVRFIEQDETLLIYVSAVDRGTIDTILDRALQQAQASVETGYAFRVLVVERLLFPTPYVKERVQQTTQRVPEHLQTFTAIVLPQMKALWAGYVGLRRLLQVRRRATIEAFRTVDEALAWIERCRAEIGKATE